MKKIIAWIVFVSISVPFFAGLLAGLAYLAIKHPVEFASVVVPIALVSAVGWSMNELFGD